MAFQFVLGFKTLADQLGPEVVGVPLQEEKNLGTSLRIQPTTTGMMVYHKAANQCYFFQAARPGQ